MAGPQLDSLANRPGEASLELNDQIAWPSDAGGYLIFRRPDLKCPSLSVFMVAIR